jgi:hypothetical protein
MHSRSFEIVLNLFFLVCPEGSLKTAPFVRLEIYVAVRRLGLIWPQEREIAWSQTASFIHGTDALGLISVAPFVAFNR